MRIERTFNRRRNLNSDDIKLAAVVAIVALLGLWSMLIFSEMKCDKQWERSGLRAEWGLFQGCMVQKHDGTWVPAYVIRDVQQ